MQIDLNKIFDDVLYESKVEYRDALLDPYGNTARATDTQKKAWRFLKKYQGQKYTTADGVTHTLAPLVGMIGAKGSSKTHWGACFACEMGQNYPGSVGCLISNSYTQAKDNGGPLLIKVASKLGWEVEFFNQKKINGRSYSSVYRVTMTQGKEFFVLIRSFDAINKLEGAEIDWGWAEEVQDSDKDALTIFVTRIRGAGSPNCIFAAGMPENGTHWQYKALPKLGYQEEEHFEGIIEKEIVDPETNEIMLVPSIGILYEPSVFENKQNVGAEYINRLLEAYSPEDAQRYVYGKRGGSRSDRVFFQYRDDLHRKGTMSKMLCDYTPHRDLVISYDFNVYPMSVSLYQEKDWNDGWDDLVMQDRETWIHMETEEIFERPEDYLAPDRKVWAQVDEFEVWPDDPKGGMTRGAVSHIEAAYSDHPGKVIVLGDASGNQRRSSSTTTDWGIIGKSMKKFVQPIVKRGLIANSDLKAGITRYSNPAQRDVLQNANRMLMDANGQAWVCFMSESKYGSGGLAGSVSGLGFKADGTFDVREERKMDRNVARSHFGDTFKYFAWYGRPPSNTKFQNPERGKSDVRRRLEKQREEREEYADRGGWSF